MEITTEQDVVAAIKNGLLAREIVARAGITLYQLRLIKQRYNLVGVAAKIRLGKTENTILPLLKKGWSNKEIVKKIGVCSSDVTAVRKKHGIKAPKYVRRYLIACVVCGKERSTNSRGTKYCSPPCRKKHYKFLADHRMIIAEAWTKCARCDKYFPTYKRISPGGIPDICNAECKTNYQDRTKYTTWPTITTRLEREPQTTTQDEFRSVRAIQCSRIDSDNIQCRNYAGCLEKEVEGIGGFAPNCARYEPRKSVIGHSVGDSFGVATINV